MQEQLEFPYINENIFNEDGICKNPPPEKPKIIPPTQEEFNFDES